MTPICTALASFGMSGRVFHSPLLNTHKGFKITHVLERHNNISQKFCPDAKLVRVFSDLINDPKIELIIINTPDYLHFEMAKEAIQAGKHVVVEKPFVLNSTDGQTLIKMAQERNIVLSVFHNRRWDNDFLTIKSLLNQNILGEIVEYEAHFDRFSPEPRSGWKNDSSNGTGTLYNLGSHLIDQALVLFGMPQLIWADTRIIRSKSNTDDYFMLYLKYKNHVCILRTNYLAKEPGPKYMIHGDRGSFVKYGIDPQEEALDKGIVPGSEGWGLDLPANYGILHQQFENNSIKEAFPTIAGNYLIYYDSIYKAIRENGTLEVTASQALDVIRVIEAAKKSVLTQSIITI